MESDDLIFSGKLSEIGVLNPDFDDIALTDCCWEKGRRFVEGKELTERGLEEARLTLL